jgi:hypothetical protein
MTLNGQNARDKKRPVLTPFQMTPVRTRQGDIGQSHGRRRQK